MKLNLAIVVDSLVVNGGAERVLEASLEVFPDAPVYSLVYFPSVFTESIISQKQIFTSFVDRLPFAHTNYRNYIFLLPFAIEQFDLRRYDILLSFSYAVAHGILTRPDQLHISYTHTPMRQAWHQYFQFLEDARLQTGIRSIFARFILHNVRQWDFSASARVDHFLAASRWVARGIWRAYHREAEILYPPVDVNKTQPTGDREDYFITIARQESHKKVAMVVEAFTRLGLPLVVIGKGREEGRVHQQAGGNIRILGWQPDHIVQEYLSKARAYVMAGEEDFSIAAVEAQAAGIPVIAYGGGGVCETVIEGKTGLFYGQQNADSLINAVLTFVEVEKNFRTEDLLQNAALYSKERFQGELDLIVRREWEKFRAQK